MTQELIVNYELQHWAFTQLLLNIVVAERPLLMCYKTLGPVKWTNILC